MPPQIPTPGADWQVWGGELVDFLRIALADPGGGLLAPVILQGSHASAPQGRVLAGGNGVSVSDSGPGGAVSLAVAVDNATLQLVSGSIQISDGGVISQKLADGSVVLAKIADGAVSNAKLAGGIGMTKIAWPGDTSKFIRADGTAQPVVVQIPTGMCLPYAADSPPPGTDFLPCDGAAVSRTTYASLFTAIGTLHGAGDGSTTFNVPDMRGRVAVGKGTHTDVNLVGKTDPVASVANRRPKHQHTVYDPQHSHPPAGGGDGYVYHKSGGGDDVGGSGTAIENANTGSASTGVKVNPEGTSSSVSPVDAPAYLVVLWCIKT
jgi:microcystin-dependent protein